MSGAKKYRESNPELNFVEAINILEACRKVCNKVPSDLDSRIAEIKLFKESYETLDRNEDAKGCRPLRILKRPRPNFTDVARKNLTTGTIILKVIFGSDSKIKAVATIQSLPDGLTAKAVEAAKKIEFVPPKCGTQTVDAVKILKFNIWVG